VEQKDDLGLRSIIVTAFCLLASLGAGFSFREIAAHVAGWQVVAYAFGGGIFLAISAIFLYLALSPSDGE
jgi:hypothetical protein